MIVNVNSEKPLVLVICNEVDSVESLNFCRAGPLGVTGIDQGAIANLAGIAPAAGRFSPGIARPG